MAGVKDIYYIEVLGKALAILDVFVRLDKPRLTLQEITAQSRLSKNTVFRILYTLADQGYIVKQDAAYELGHKLLDLANTRLRRKDLSAIAGPYMDRLREQFNETVNLGVLDGAQIRYVDVRESRSRFRLAERIGGSDFLHCTALGKAHLAFLPADQAHSLLKEGGMPKLTARTLTTLSAMKTELNRIRKTGCAVDREESMLGAFCVGVPIIGGNGAPLAALSVSGPTVRFNQSVLPQVSRALLDAAAEIRKRMGNFG
ncbi:MAG TPA: IclR family transcriptional regulator [Bryobacteraceae bacterium]|jgi:IclR family acetate operon transcriptional repressor